MPIEVFVGLIIGSLIGLCVGATISWVACASREAGLRAVAIALEGQRAAAAEAVVEETRGQFNAAKAEIEAARETVRKYQTAWTTAKTRLDATEKNLEDQKALVELAKAKLSDTFASLAAKALAQSNQGFLVLAEEKFKAIKGEAAADLDARRGAIAALVNPLAETLNAYQQHTKELEATRLREIGAVGEQLRKVAATEELIRLETAKLIGALKHPHVRGRWGEVALRKTAELAGMTPHCDYVEQETVSTDGGGRIRPDMVVKLPAGREVVVDSKVPLNGFMEALEAHTEEERCAALDKHAKQVSQHVSKLSAKEYWGQFSLAPEFVVLFIPNDSFLAAAAEKDPDLVAFALSKRIVLATPTTFIALLRAIEFGWRQHDAVENAGQIRNLGQELSDRIATLVDYLNKVGAALGKAVEAYNAAVASFEGRILPTARRFKALGAMGRKEIEELKVSDEVPRRLFPPDAEDKGESPDDKA